MLHNSNGTGDSNNRGLRNGKGKKKKKKRERKKGERKVAFIYRSWLAKKEKVVRPPGAKKLGKKKKRKRKKRKGSRVQTLRNFLRNWRLQFHSYQKGKKKDPYKTTENLRSLKSHLGWGFPYEKEEKEGERKKGEKGET